MIPRALFDFYVASCTPDGGVYRIRFFDDASSMTVGKLAMPDPMYIHKEQNTLWAVLRSPFKDSTDSGVLSFDLTTQEQSAPLMSTGGAVGCHLAVRDGEAYCANYIGGSVIKLPDRLVFHTGCGIDPKRQKTAHPHFVTVSECGSFVYVCDLGTDKVTVYDRDLKPLYEACVPAGAGVRHGLISKDGSRLYCINEMGGSISVFSLQPPRISLLGTVSVMHEGYEGVASGAAIKASACGKYLYITERATASIVTLKVGEELPSVLYRTDCRGVEPRDITPVGAGRYLVCTNQFSNSVSVFALLDSGEPEYIGSVPIAAPLCAVEA